MKKEKSFEDRIIRTADLYGQRKKEKEFSKQVLTTLDLSDRQIRQALEGPKPEEEEENEEQKH